jgi:hypothetical protein
LPFKCDLQRYNVGDFLAKLANIPSCALLTEYVNVAKGMYAEAVVYGPGKFVGGAVGAPAHVDSP